MKINKPILDWTEKDLKKLRKSSHNLEDKNLEYKERYSKDPDELRRDIVSFANTDIGGYILFGIQDDPFEIIGMEREEVDNLKNTINNIIWRSIDPHLDPPPDLNPIYLSNGLYILGMQIFPKKQGLYGIRKSDNPNNSDFKFYTFWVRMDGNKNQLTMKEVNSYMPGYYEGIEFKGMKESKLQAISMLQNNPFMKKELENYLQNRKYKKLHEDRARKSSKRFRNK